MINIAHLSDIHFGNNFSKTTWNAVADVVVDSDPDLIVVSGDLVDNPAPGHLLAAKCALFGLERRAREESKTNRQAQLIVIPGNHDVFETGLAVGLHRLDWFERIFGADTKAAEAVLKQQLQVEELGFDGRCLGFPGEVRPQDAGLYKRWRAWLSAVWAGRTTPEMLTDHLVKAKPSPRVRSAGPILLALLDSNPTQRGGDLATGIVDNDALMALNRELAQIKTRHVVRIAVVHHHVLPVAFAAGAEGLTGEPMMVLKNAGVVLRILADQKFDLILHGHWHKTQFAWIDFGTNTKDSYPIAVASAGSAAWTSKDPAQNSLNLITIADNGRVSVKSLYYGGPRAPNTKDNSYFREYTEPLAAAKRRAYFRARELHDMECEKREQICQIKENGELWVMQRVVRLRVKDEGTTTLRRRFLGIGIPENGQLIPGTFKPDGDSSREGVTVQPAPGHPGSRKGQLEYYYINLPGRGLEKGGLPLSYAVSYGCAKVKMKSGQNNQRGVSPLQSDLDQEYEYIGTRISYPVGEIVLKVTFPQSLAMVQPYVECKRHPDYPFYPVDDGGDIDRDPSEMEIDRESQKEAQRDLCYDAPTRTWSLEIERPMVGYHYGIRWRVPTTD